MLDDKLREILEDWYPGTQYHEVIPLLKAAVVDRHTEAVRDAKDTPKGAFKSLRPPIKPESLTAILFSHFYEYGEDKDNLDAALGEIKALILKEYKVHLEKDSTEEDFIERIKFL